MTDRQTSRHGRAAVISQRGRCASIKPSACVIRHDRPFHPCSMPASVECRPTLLRRETRSVSSWLRRYQCNVIGDRAQIGTDAGAVRVDDDVAACGGARQCEDAAGIEIRRAKADRADKRRSVAHRHRVGRYDRADRGRVRYLRCVRSYRDHSRWRWWRWRWRRRVAVACAVAVVGAVSPHDREAAAGRSQSQPLLG